MSNYKYGNLMWISLLISTSTICGCGVDKAGSKTTAPSAEIRNQCIHAHNSAENPCSISVYEMISSPDKWSGMYLEFLAYAPANGVRLVFPSKDASEFEDYQSSFLIAGGEESKLKTEGYVVLRAKFEKDRSDYGVASGTRRQIGVLSNLDVRRRVTSISERRNECGKACVVRHLDGKKQ